MGFGNPVRSDGGVGDYVIDQLRVTLDGQPGVGLFDMGMSAFGVLFQLRGYPMVIAAAHTWYFTHHLNGNGGPWETHLGELL